MRLTIRHRFDFGDDRPLVGDDLVRPESWDALRVASSGPFALPKTREQWEDAATSAAGLKQRANALDRWLKDAGVQRLASYGVGAAFLELWLTRLAPERQMVLTDYAPEAVARLRDLFPEVEVLGADLRDTPPVRADVHLFHRIDSELSDAEWRDLLERFRDERLLVVATEVLGPRRILEEMLLRMPGRNASSAGWTRTRDAFEALWRPTHDAQPIDAFDLMAWSLQPRNRRQGRG